jgi:hypothetical protein
LHDIIPIVNSTATGVQVKVDSTLVVRQQRSMLTCKTHSMQLQR